MHMQLLDAFRLRLSVKESLRFYIRCLICLALLILAATAERPTFAAYAQTNDPLEVLPPEVSDFPNFSFQFRFDNLTKAPVEGLQLHDLALFENEQKVDPLLLIEQQMGVQFTLVINGGRELDVRDAQGVSPYMQINSKLMDWVEHRRFHPEDMLSIVVQEGALIRNTIDRKAWNIALEEYQPNFRAMTPNLVALETALNLAEERVVPFGVEKTLLYITPPPSVDEVSEVVRLTEFAAQAGIRVNIWMLGDEYHLTNDQGAALMDLTVQTGGVFFYVTDFENLPEPETYLDGLGVVYEVQYRSHLREAGVYTIKLVVDLTEGAARGESHTFTIDIQPPKPILLSPPALISQQLLKSQEGGTTGFSFASQSIEFLLEFPDDHVRDLTVSKLFVDGQVVDQRNEEPFSPLTWDLTELDESGEYDIKVMVEDTLGLSGETIITPIQVEVDQPELAPDFSQGKFGIIIIGIILSFSTILLLGWSIRKGLKLKFMRSPTLNDDKTQDETNDDDFLSIIPANGVYATFLQLGSEGVNFAGAAFRITKNLSTFGSDPNLADQILQHESISPMHARFGVRQNGFWLCDLDSDYGTWVNYAQIDGKPVQIHPGDIIHFGNLGFRFTIINIDSPPIAKAEDYERLL